MTQQYTLDFYIGKQNSSQWIGSCIGDNIFDVPKYILRKTDWYKYLTSVIKYIRLQDIAAIPFRGESWMWMWPDSSNTQYSFHFDLTTNRVIAAVSYYHNYCDAIALSRGESLQDSDLKIAIVYPNMSHYQKTKQGEPITQNGQNPT